MDFLNFKTMPSDVHIEKAKANTITNWPRPTTVKNVQIFFEIANFYQHFIFQYFYIAADLTI